MRNQEAAYSQRMMDPTLAATPAKVAVPRRKQQGVAVAFGPEGGTSGENLSVVIGAIEPGFTLRGALGPPMEAAERVRSARPPAALARPHRSPARTARPPAPLARPHRSPCLPSSAANPEHCQCRGTHKAKRSPRPKRSTTNLGAPLPLSSPAGACVCVRASAPRRDDRKAVGRRLHDAARRLRTAIGTQWPSAVSVRVSRPVRRRRAEAKLHWFALAAPSSPRPNGTPCAMRSSMLTSRTDARSWWEILAAFPQAADQLMSCSLLVCTPCSLRGGYPRRSALHVRLAGACHGMGGERSGAPRSCI